MIRFICNYSTNFTFIKTFFFSGKKGQVCAAPFEDNEWYRAVIKSINIDRTAEILYIDYGNVSMVSLDLLKEIR